MRPDQALPRLARSTASLPAASTPAYQVLNSVNRPQC